MPRNGTGTYSLPSGNPVITGTTISSTDFNNTMNDIATALSGSVSADGQTPWTGNQNANGEKVTGLAAGTAAGDSLRWQQLFSQGTEADVASAATVDLGAQNTNFLRVTGTTTITSFGTNYNGPRFLRFAGALTLTHNASTLILPGAANITTVAGDSCVVIPKATSGTADGWLVVAYQRGAFQPPTGTVIDRAYGEYTANADLTTQIPLDDTIPQNTEGTQIISVTLTPKSATNRVRLRFQGFFSTSAANNGSAAVFSSSSVNALAATTQATSGAGQQNALLLEYEYVPATTSPLTFSVRVGPATAVTMRMNGVHTGRQFGGVAKSTLIVEEIAQ